MSSIASFLKENLTSMPYWLGRHVAKIPFGKRPGMGKYILRCNEIDAFNTFSSQERQEFVFKHFKNLAVWSFNNIEFYRSLYDSRKFNPELELKSFDDIALVPIINKEMLQRVSLEKRSYDTKDRYKVNTGGSSGTPLTIYVSSDSMAHEWAHMHKIWSKLGYNQAKLKLTLGGRSFSEKPVEYDFVRHHYGLSIYRDFNLIKEDLIKILSTKKIEYLHGYPSAIYELAHFVSKRDNVELLHAIKSNLKGIFYGSEFPLKEWRSFSKNIFGVPSVSWYGHTERAILAYEKEEEYKYSPMHTYGFTEVVQNELIGTSYHNYVSPLIRYNTEDVVNDVIRNQGFIDSFQVKEGRIGSFVKDTEGKSISVTGLVFGRHHELFDKCKYIQLRQLSDGIVEVLFTPISEVNIFNPAILFDSKDVNIKFIFKQLEEPILTESGKLKILIK